MRAERPATVGLVPRPSRSNPEVPQRIAKAAAARGEINFRTRGLFRVRVIKASYLGSKSILNVFAQAQDKKVPVVRKSRVRVEVEKEVSTDEAVVERISGIGYKEYAEVVVRRIKKDKRGLVRDKYVAAFLRNVAEVGKEVAAVVNCDEASSGRDSSWEFADASASASAGAGACPSISIFLRCLLR